jgi:hypothetical protein
MDELKPVKHVLFELHAVMWHNCSLSPKRGHRHYATVTRFMQPGVAHVAIAVPGIVKADDDRLGDCCLVLG